MDHVQSWVIGGLLAIGLPCAFKWLSDKGIKALVAWQMGELKNLLNAKTGDPALDAFEHDLVLALAKFAKAKFPASGLGLERKAFLVSFLTAKVPLFKGQESRLSELIDQIVAAEKGVLDSIQ